MIIIGFAISWNRDDSCLVVQKAVSDVRKIEKIDYKAPEKRQASKRAKLQQNTSRKPKQPGTKPAESVKVKKKIRSPSTDSPKIHHWLLLCRKKIPTDSFIGNLAKYIDETHLTSYAYFFG